jgi:hypothetical protein
MIKMRIKLFGMKLKIAVQTLAWLFKQPRYIAFAAIISLLFFEFVYWMFNVPLLTTLMASTNLSFYDKLSLLTGPFTYVQNQNGMAVFSMMIGLALIQGASLAALTFAIRHQPKTDSKLIGGSAVVGFLAIVGLGCPACGTSLITPIIALFISGSAVAVSEQITAFTLPLAIIVGVYGLYATSLRASTIKASSPITNAEPITD